VPEALANLKCTRFIHVMRHYGITLNEADAVKSDKISCHDMQSFCTKEIGRLQARTQHLQLTIRVRALVFTTTAVRRFASLPSGA
jgi:hypothetical protein